MYWAGRDCSYLCFGQEETVATCVLGKEDTETSVMEQEHTVATCVLGLEQK